MSKEQREVPYHAKVLAMSNENEVVWISDRFGISLKIKVSKESVNALKKFIEVLEIDLKDREQKSDTT